MESIDEYILNHKTEPIKSMSFIAYFYLLLKEKNLDPKDVYKSTNMSRQTFSKIINNESHPTFNNAIKLVIGLRCNQKECKMLLKKLDYNLASYSKFNMIIRYCLDHQIYDIIKINSLLLSHTNKTLDD